MEKALKKAYEGGYNIMRAYITVERTERPDGIDELAQLSQHKALLDPLFWQTLGKAEGWGNYNQLENKEMDWKDYWHRFIDHLASDGTPDTFFEELLTKEK